MFADSICSLAVVAEFDADELVTQREHVSRDIRDRLIRRAENYNIVFRDVSITKLEFRLRFIPDSSKESTFSLSSTHFCFSPEYTAAIERKQVEQQIAERQKFVVERAKQEKMAAVIRVEGETEAGRLISEAMQISPEFLELRSLSFILFFQFIVILVSLSLSFFFVVI